VCLCVRRVGMLGEKQRSTESHPGQSECAGMGGWVDNVVRAKRKSERRGINVIKTVVSISSLGPCFKKQTQHPGRKSPLLSSKDKRQRVDEIQIRHKLVVFHQFIQYLPTDLPYVSVCKEDRCILGFCGRNRKQAYSCQRVAVSLNYL